MSADDDLTLPGGAAAGAGATRSVTPFVARAAAPGTPGRFTPGAIIAGRYRLVALLGRGGMGEVYRAEDLTLDQTVALKFLQTRDASGDSAHDPERLAQFHNELRIARQVSHKNVCRLYDLGEADGRRFLTMEYVDGEDLAALLRRIGRFPEDRAVAIARQLCAGIAAAHDRGVIHRDLKPANVMIDGEGDVRITDFGIATATADASAGLAGTPQYMAPEQLTGSAASIKTDLYALGLILFEIFTGKRAHEAKTLGDLKALHDTGTVTTPSSIVRDLDPAIERVILRCLDRDPAKRPASALAVAVALPGGDPLAAALAAGETPSPDVLAAAAETEAIPVVRGLTLIGVVIASVAIYASLSPRGTLANLVPLEKPPEVLAYEARQLLNGFGYTDAPADTAHNFIVPPDYRRWLVDTDQTVNRWNPARVGKGPAMLFWYRTSPRDLEPDSPSPMVSPTDPGLTLTGQTLVILDTRGRLVEFRRVPPQRDAAAARPADAPAPDWSAAFRAAGLVQSAFTPVDPEWAPKDFADTRAAWEGPSPDDSSIRMRVEAAAYGGKISSVYLVGPWARPRAMVPLTQSNSSRIRALFSMMLWVGMLIGALFVAQRNLKSNRADRRGGTRLAIAYLIVQLVAWIAAGHHRSSAMEEVNSFFRVTGNVLLEATLLGVLYLALEPYGRRFWPDGLLGWSRLLSGRVRDSRIGRDVLIGTAFGGALLMVDLLRSLAPNLFGLPGGIPTLGSDVGALNGPGFLVRSFASQFYGSLQTALLIVMLLIVVRLVVRRTWIATLVGLVILVAAAGGGVSYGGNAWVYYTAQTIALSLITIAIFRFGLLVTVVMLLTDNIPSAIPIVMSGASWATLPGRLALGVVLALACFGFYAARAGQPLFGKLEG